MRNYHYIIISCCIAFSCVKKDPKTTSQDLDQIISNYQNYKGFDEEVYPLGLFTKAYFQSRAEFAQATLDSLSQINLNELNETELISAQLLEFVLKSDIEDYKNERFLNPILSDAGFHSNLPYMVGPLNNYEEVADYLNKLNAIPDYVDQHLVILREGLAKGVSQPPVIFKGYESSYNDHIVEDYEDSYYYKPFKNLPNDLSLSQKDSVLEVAKSTIQTKVIPQFQRIKSFFETEYFIKTRRSLGLSETPDGMAKYQALINYFTTSTAYTADDIHNIGLEEVARIKAAMEQIIADLRFEGSFADFLNFLRTDQQFYAKSPEELLRIGRDMAKRADAQLPRFFKTLPRRPYGVAPVPDAIAPKYTGGRYIPPSGDTSPGYYWINTYDLKSRTLYTLPSLTVHEAVPGHHLQGSLNNELGDSIPQFRKDLYLSAYGEGWGLYTEFLAEEMGMYTTPYEKFGQLTYEMWRACRLVVDTGIHAKGWTREQVVNYMASNTALSLHEVNTETDRYISWPGQALSYKIGELKIRELRKKAEVELGSDFDIREFHEIVLEQGTVTLSILENRVNQYIQRMKDQ